MTFLKISILILLLPSMAFAGPLDPRFFASREFQNQFPGAFALQAESQEFVARSLPETLRAGNVLIGAIQRIPGLASAVLRFPRMTEAERIQIMNQVFFLQTRSSGFQAPELVLDNEAPRSAFFEFNPKAPGPGKVILNPAKLFKDANPYSALLFLIHETRHAQQFQLAFGPSPGNHGPSAQAYKAAFTAQKQIFDQSTRTAYCDFLTLNNEYEAFMFGNYVMEKLTLGAVDTSEMGTWASQYTLERGLRIHLPMLALRVGAENLLNAFNRLEVIQYQEVFGGQR
jgi:hypothetical protein